MHKPRASTHRINSAQDAIKYHVVAPCYPRLFVKSWTSTINTRIKMPYYESFCNFILKEETMLQALHDSFDGVRGKMAAAVIGAGLSVASLGAASAQDLAKNDQQATTATQEMTGKPVTLRVGPDFNREIAESMARNLIKDGCPTTVTSERGFPGHVTVDIEGFNPSKFNIGETGDAGLVAERLCLGT